ncbi:probable RNA polymerase II nuclear localization protein SLC7A6OS [Lepisosteus oculatus]|uniref:probable RNA polymerase II nuclear localization protein SLC7A6OS n=1 Tax=Lepisosteus oculatus TaxID=7918 RepID=UPI0035F4FF17
MEPRSTILRVKRKQGTDPADALLLACKRLRYDPTSQPAVDSVPESGDTEIQNSVFKLAATVASKAAPVETPVREALSRQQALRPSAGSAQRIVGSLRTAKWQSRREERYRVLSQHRPGIARDAPAAGGGGEEHTGHTGSAALGDLPDFQVLDIVQEEEDTDLADGSLPVASAPEAIVCNSVRLIREKLSVSEGGVGSQHREKEDQYVYDIYYQETAAPGWIQDILSVRPYFQENELVAEGDPKEDESYEDEDDENEEGNWRNDYPDEEDSEEDGERERRYRYSGYGDDIEHDCDDFDEDFGVGQYGRRSWDRYRRDLLQELDDDDDDDKEEKMGGFDSG